MREVTDEHDARAEEILREAADREELHAVLVARREQRHLAADGVLGDVEQRADGEIRADDGDLAARHAVVAAPEAQGEAEQRAVEQRPVRPAAVAAAPRPIAAGARIALYLVRQDGARHAVSREQEILRRRIDDDARDDLMIHPFHPRTPFPKIFPALYHAQIPVANARKDKVN